MDDSKLIELFNARSELAIEELIKKYGRLCQSISYNILANSEDVEECLNDTYLSIWNSIPPANPNPLVAYICATVRNISLAMLRRNTAQKRKCEYTVVLDELEDILQARENVENEILSKELSGYIERFLDNQTEENRCIFLSRYYFLFSYEAIAQRTGLSVKNISVRLVRMRKALKKDLEKRGVM